MKNIFAKLNVELSKVNPETNSFAEIIDTLAESGATTADIIDAFGKVAGPQMATLIKEGGDALRQYTADVTGTEAAAATAVVMELTAMPGEPVDVTVDRPFVFLIRDIETGALLFVGRVANPLA